MAKITVARQRSHLCFPSPNLGKTQPQHRSNDPAIRAASSIAGQVVSSIQRRNRAAPQLQIVSAHLSSVPNQDGIILPSQSSHGVRSQINLMQKPNSIRILMKSVFQ
ncbi:hypothetical protein ACLOJK_034905 [Asimina triloba]